MNNKPWTDKELEQLSALVAAGGTAFHAAAKLNRRIVSCRNQARKLGTPFTDIRIARMKLRANWLAAEKT